MEARRDAAVRLLRWMLASTVVIPAALFTYVAVISYFGSFSLADERIERSLDAVGGHVTKVFQSINVTIAAVKVLIDGRSDDQIRSSEQELHRQLKEIDDELPGVDAIWVFDRNGHPLVSSFVFPVPRELDVSDRDYFRAHLKRDAPTFVGQIHTPRVTTEPFFAVSRRRNGPGDAFDGVLVASVLPSDFHKFYER